MGCDGLSAPWKRLRETVMLARGTGGEDGDGERDVGRSWWGANLMTRRESREERDDLRMLGSSRPLLRVGRGGAEGGAEALGRIRGRCLWLEGELEVERRWEGKGRRLMGRFQFSQQALQRCQVS
eukprot:3774409-Rhodomonas_salina.1